MQSLNQNFAGGFHFVQCRKCRAVIADQSVYHSGWETSVGATKERVKCVVFNAINNASIGPPPNQKCATEAADFMVSLRLGSGMNVDKISEISCSSCAALSNSAPNGQGRTEKHHHVVLGYRVDAISLRSSSGASSSIDSRAAGNELSHCNLPELNGRYVLLVGHVDINMQSYQHYSHTHQLSASALASSSSSSSLPLLNDEPAASESVPSVPTTSSFMVKAQVEKIVNAQVAALENDIVNMKRVLENDIIDMKRVILKLSQKIQVAEQQQNYRRMMSDPNGSGGYEEEEEEEEEEVVAALSSHNKRLAAALVTPQQLNGRGNKKVKRQRR